MKKEYIAPDLYYEPFVLSQSIAAGCAEKGIEAAQLWNSLWGYFTDSDRLTCTLTDFNDDDFESYCYWQGSIKMFLS
ncbi:MAG: hypothetical protein LUD14_00865 [Clostridiales bacterium]|nr:hypothetical protein [Clostridiales bacterium]